jgi:hypothetical protein
LLFLYGEDEAEGITAEEKKRRRLFVGLWRASKEKYDECNQEEENGRWLLQGLQ